MSEPWKGVYLQEPYTGGHLPAFNASQDAVAIIPARGGSVRIPRKNIRPFHGAPIITYSIHLAKQCGLFNRVIVSTDDDEIRKVARQWGAEVAERPRHLIEPDPGTQAIAADLLTTLGRQAYVPRFACVIYATAPLMRRQDLLRGYVEVAKGRQFAFAVGTEPLQDAGQFYWGWRQAFVNDEPLIATETAMIPVPAAHVCDINIEADWARAEELFTAAMKVEGAAP